MDKLNLMHKF